MKEIPAVFGEISNAQVQFGRLIENLRSRYPTPTVLMHEIERLKSRGYRNVTIGEMLGIDGTMVAGLFNTLKIAGVESPLDPALLALLADGGRNRIWKRRLRFWVLWLAIMGIAVWLLRFSLWFVVLSGPAIICGLVLLALADSTRLKRRIYNRFNKVAGEVGAVRRRMFG